MKSVTAPPRDRPPRRKVRSLMTRCEQGYLCEVWEPQLRTLSIPTFTRAACRVKRGFESPAAVSDCGEFLRRVCRSTDYPVPGTHSR